MGRTHTGWLITQICLMSSYVSVRAKEAVRAPDFDEKPSNTVVLDGVRAWLNCSASGHPKPTYEWLLGLEKVVVVSDDRRYVLSDGSLIFNPFNKSLDRTIYYCKAKNSVSSILSEGVLIDVARPPVVTLPPRNVSVNESENVTFTCAGDSFPSPTYRWTLGHDEKTFRQTGANNKLTNVSPGDSGEYTCEVSNIAGRATATAFLHVKYSPSATISPSALTVAHHEKPTLTCSFKGYPFASVQWLSNGRALSPGPRVDINREITSTRVGEGVSRLTLKNLHRQDSGTYTCLVTNELGSFNVTSQLLVQFPPDPPKLQGTAVDTTVILEWLPIHHTNRSPPITSFTVIYRQQNESRNESKQLFLDADDHTTSIERLKKGKVYSFIITASNSIGQSSPSKSVTVKIAPTAPDAAPVLLSATSLSSSSIHVEWKPVQSDGGTPITHYKVEYKTVEGDEWLKNSVNGYTDEQTIRGLSSSTTYVFRVSAKNAVGVSQPSNSLMANTLIIGTPSMISHVAVFEVTETSAKVRWTVPDSRLEENQKIERYIILFSTKNGTKDTRREEINAPFAVEGDRIEYELKDLLCAVTYQVTVSAVSSQGQGPQSSPVKFTTRAEESEDAKNATARTCCSAIDMPSNDGADAGSLVKDNAAYIAGGVAVIVVFSAVVVVLIVWRCHRVSADDTGSSTATMKSDLESPTASLQYSPAKHPPTDIRNVLEDERMVSVRAAFEQAVAPTPPPELTRADSNNPFISLGDDTLGEEHIPSHLGSQVNSFHEAGYHMELGNARSKSLSVDALSEFSDEARRKRNVRFGTPDVMPTKRMAVSPARSMPNNQSYSLRGIQLKNKSIVNSCS